MDNQAKVTVTQAAEQLGISRYQVYRRITRGDLPAHKVRMVNVHWMINQTDLDTYIAAGGAQQLSAPREEPPSGKDTLRVPEAALATGYSAETIRRMCHEGILPHTKGRGPKGQFRIPRAALKKILR